MAIHACQINPTDTAPLDCLAGPALEQSGMLRAGTLPPPFLHCLYVGVGDATTLSYLDAWCADIGCYLTTSLILASLDHLHLLLDCQS